MAIHSWNKIQSDSFRDSFNDRQSSHFIHIQVTLFLHAHTNEQSHVHSHLPFKPFIGMKFVWSIKVDFENRKLLFIDRWKRTKATLSFQPVSQPHISAYIRIHFRPIHNLVPSVSPVQVEWPKINMEHKFVYIHHAPRHIQTTCKKWNKKYGAKFQFLNMKKESEMKKLKMKWQWSRFRWKLNKT